MSKYSLGIDFGTLSGRAILIDIENGNEAATEVMEYAHSVMDEVLCDGITKLPGQTALQNPADYIEVLGTVIPNVIKKAGVNPKDIIGVGVDFTASTVMPINSEGEPLCFKKEYKSNPNAYVKLWKHHSAQYEAERFTNTAKECGETFLKYYGGKMSSEWMFPKIMQILDEDEELFEAADRFIEAGDWIVLKLTGEEKRSLCQAGYKAAWNRKDGYPSKEFLKKLNPKLENVVEEKLNTKIYKTTECAGYITKEAAELTGLCEGTAVAVANIDAHVALPAAGVTKPGKLLMIMGTSTCHIMMSETESFIEGVSGVVEDGIVPGYFAYEAGQACVGDHFEWFVKNAVPHTYYLEAEKCGKSIFTLLEEKASRLKPGESGLIALDWFNGNRMLSDANLSGMILGYTLRTKPEEIYRALIEATAFGTKLIIDTFEEGGVRVDELIAAGGLPQKNSMLMQIYADITQKPIKVAKSKQACAVGAAIFGAVAAGRKNGGYDNIDDASKNIAQYLERSYTPIAENVGIYESIYKEYKKLHEYFGYGENNVMKYMRELKRQK